MLFHGISSEVLWEVSGVEVHFVMCPWCCRSELAAATQKRLEDAAAKKEEEEAQKAAQRHVRREYKCAHSPHPPSGCRPDNDAGVCRGYFLEMLKQCCNKPTPIKWRTGQERPNLFMI